MDTHICLCYNISVRWRRSIFDFSLLQLSQKAIAEREVVMPEEKKSTYTGQTDARRRASAKYLKESVEDVRIRVPKGQKDIIKAHAEQQGESMNQFVIRAIREAMERDS